jgi:hypothetical protein
VRGVPSIHIILKIDKNLKGKKSISKQTNTRLLKIDKNLKGFYYHIKPNQYKAITRWFVF